MAVVAINGQVSARALALAALVITPLPVQVVALALTSVWVAPWYYTSPTVDLIRFLAAGMVVASALTILLLLPVHDAIGLVQHLPVAAAAAAGKVDARGADRQMTDEVITSTFLKLSASHDLKVAAEG